MEWCVCSYICCDIILMFVIYIDIAQQFIKHFCLVVTVLVHLRLHMLNNRFHYTTRIQRQRYCTTKRVVVIIEYNITDCNTYCYYQLSHIVAYAVHVRVLLALQIPTHAMVWCRCVGVIIDTIMTTYYCYMTTHSLRALYYRVLVVHIVVFVL